MSSIKESVEVECPTHYVMQHALRFFTVRRRDVAPGTISLRVDLSNLSLPGSSQARHTVSVRHDLVAEPGTPGVLELSWDPEDRTVPSFKGTLRCEGGDGRSVLALEGEYKPPLGVAGAVFDLVVGRRIASATLGSLLADIKAFVEADFQTALSTNLADSPKD